MDTSSPIPWRTRPDLVSVGLGIAGDTSLVADQQAGGENSGFQYAGDFAVKDEVRSEFYRFGELEFFILQSLRKSVSLARLKQSIESSFGVSIDFAEIVSYINRLAKDNLLVALRLGDGERLFKQNQAERSGRLAQRIQGLMSIKLPGFYPGPILAQLKPIGSLCFHPISILFVCCAALFTFVYAMLSLETVMAKAPAISELISPTHLGLMLVGFMVAKVLHELGHGLACQNTGHECTEMGVLLLVFIPCLYCDVSDLWTEKSRWKRMFVSLAGVFVELAIATICFWGWYFSLDGHLQRFLFGMMLITSVNTLFINGNPLMRYDGYYALSDWVRIPNLSAVSKQFFNGRIQDFFIPTENHLKFSQNGWFLGLYAFASLIYRYFILAAIGWAAWMFFDSQQLTTVGNMLVCGLVLISVVPILAGSKNAVVAGLKQGLRLFNVFVFLVLIGFCALLLGAIEFSHEVRGEAEIQLADARQIFAPVDGQLVTCCLDGHRAEKGELVANIVNEDLELEAMTITSELQDIELRLSALRLASESSVVAGDIEFWQKRKSSKSRNLKEIESRLQSLSIRSPLDGVVVAARRSKFNDENDVQDLSILKGSLFAESNRGCYVKRGEPLAYVASPERCTGFVEVSERDIELVKVGQSVSVLIPHSDRVVDGVVSKVSLESEAEMANDKDSSSAAELLSRFYIVEFEFETDPQIRIGSYHQSVIICKRTTPLGWLQRWWRNSIWF
jgi:putative peptide zinc metalloprotease protein